jgi:hypothetical protein
LHGSAELVRAALLMPNPNITCNLSGQTAGLKMMKNEH